MIKTVLALALVSVLVSAQTISAFSVAQYDISGNSCVSISSGATGVYTRWGVKAPSSSAIDVTCPVVLPRQNYNRILFQLNGYNRVSANQLSCTVSATDTYGGYLQTLVTNLPLNSSPGQTNTNSVDFNADFFIHAVSIRCRLPAGENYLTHMQLQMFY